MLFIISSLPGTQEFKTALQIAEGSDICLIHDAVYLSMEEEVSISGKVYALKDDLSLRGITRPGLKGLKIIDYSEMVDLMAQAEKVVGVF